MNRVMPDGQRGRPSPARAQIAERAGSFCRGEFPAERQRIACQTIFTTFLDTGDFTDLDKSLFCNFTQDTPGGFVQCKNLWDDALSPNENRRKLGQIYGGGDPDAERFLDDALTHVLRAEGLVRGAIAQVERAVEAEILPVEVSEQLEAAGEEAVRGAAARTGAAMIPAALREAEDLPPTSVVPKRSVESPGEVLAQRRVGTREGVPVPGRPPSIPVRGEVRMPSRTPQAIAQGLMGDIRKAVQPRLALYPTFLIAAEECIKRQKDWSETLLGGLVNEVARIEGTMTGTEEQKLAAYCQSLEDSKAVFTLRERDMQREVQGGAIRPDGPEIARLSAEKMRFDRVFECLGCSTSVLKPLSQALAEAMT